MENKMEKKFLSQLNKLIIDGSQIKRSMIIRSMILTVCWILLVTVIVLLNRKILSGVIGATITVFIGIIVGYTMRTSDAAKQWPFLKQHLSVESIQKRLEEIET